MSSVPVTSPLVRRGRLTFGPRVVRFIEAFLVFSEGDLRGKPARLEDWQKEELDALYQVTADGFDADGQPLWRRAWDEAFLSMARGGGKTQLIGWCAAAELFADVWAPGLIADPNVVVAASTYEQAGLLFGAARTTLTEGLLAEMVEGFETEVVRKDGHGVLSRIVAVASTAEGLRNTAVFVDEVHELRGSANKDRLLNVLRLGAGKRRNGWVVSISTAGDDLDTEWGRLYLKAMRAEKGELDDPRFYSHVWQAPEGTDLDDDESLLAGLTAACPGIGNFRPLEAAFRQARELPVREVWRYLLNRPYLGTDDGWLVAGSWEAGEAGWLPIPDGSPVWVGVDVALKHDTSAVVIAYPVWPDGHEGDPEVWVQARVWDAGSEASIDHLAIEAYLRDLADRYQVVSILADPAYFAASLSRLDGEGLPVLEFPQSPQRMVRAVGRTRQLIADGKVHHPGDPEFSKQVLDARPRWHDMGFSLRKPRPVEGKPRAHIDAAVALTLAVWGATSHRWEEEAPAPSGPAIFDAHELLRLMEASE